MKKDCSSSSKGNIKDLNLMFRTVKRPTWYASNKNSDNNNSVQTFLQLREGKGKKTVDFK